MKTILDILLMLSGCVSVLMMFYSFLTFDPDKFGMPNNNDYITTLVTIGSIMLTLIIGIADYAITY